MCTFHRVADYPTSWHLHVARAFHYVAKLASHRSTRDQRTLAFESNQRERKGDWKLLGNRGIDISKSGQDSVGGYVS